MSFTFGGTGSGSGSGGNNLFGQSSGTNSNIFGASAAPASSGTATPSIFSQAASNANAKSNQTSSIFGNTSATSAAKPASFSFGAPASTTAPSLFSSPATAGTPAPLFGSNTATVGTPSNVFGGATSSNTPSGTTTQGKGVFGTGTLTEAPSFGSTFVFPENTAQKSAASTSTGNLFPTLNKTDNAPAASGSLFGSTTPALSRPTGSMFSFASSTTPAGTPMASKDSNTTANVLGGTKLGGTTGNLFGAPKTTVTTATTAAPQPSAGNIFGGQKTTSTGGIFGSTPAASSAGAVPATATSTAGATQPKPLFGVLPTSNATAVPTAAPAAAPTTTGSIFKLGGNITGDKTAAGTTATAASSAAPATPSLFSGFKPATTTTEATAASSAAPAAPSLFSGFKPATATTEATPASSAAPAATSLFSGFKPTTTTAAGAPASTAATSAPSLFAPKTTAATTGAATTTAAPAASAAAATGPTAAPTTANPPATVLNVSTAGPAPQMSRLKNRTMDEIITRWASDLTKYQKEFQDQATKVASWDRLLVDNGDKIQKLYTSTFEAERATTEVEKQLAAVENNQNDLEAWLDRYEHEVDEIFNRAGGPGENLQGPDQERERTYKLAEKLGDRLDEMGKDLTSMIQEINTASASLSLSTKADDPLQQIVKVLNGHLAQLQWIDQNAASLQAKVAAAQKESRDIGSSIHGMHEKHPSDELFRSYLGRR